MFYDGRALSLRAAISANGSGPDWPLIGQQWMASEWLVRKGGDKYGTHGELTLDAAVREERTVRDFATGVLNQLRGYPPPVPDAYDMVAELVQRLIDLKVWDEMYRVMQCVANGDDRPSPQFLLGLAAHWMDRNAEAREAYARVLEEQPQHRAAIFNSLLLCKSPEEGHLLDNLGTLVAQYPAENEEETKKLTDALNSARLRCEDQSATKRRVIQAELSKLPVLMEADVVPGDISLRAAVALLALFRCAKAEPGDTELPPFDGSDTPFAPVVSNRRVLFDLMRTGLVAVDPRTSTDAFSVKDGELTGWIFGRVRWRLAPATELLVEHIRALNGVIPDTWLRDVETLALEIARGEVVAYINYLAEERGWPEPRNTEEVSDLTRALVNDLPVAQTFHLAYLGAMSASDYKQKYSVSGQRAADMLVKRTGQRLESIREGRFPPKSYDRPWKLPRSAMSYALWGTILDMGDLGFEQRIADLIAKL